MPVKPKLSKSGVKRVGRSLRSGRKPPSEFSSDLVATQCSTPGCKITRNVSRGTRLTCEFCVINARVLVQARR